MDLEETARVHATRVLRMEEGDTLRVFDAGQEFSATIRTISKHRVEVEVSDAFTAAPERQVPLHLLMSPLKGDLTELVIQKATELGAARITPATFERTDTVARREPSQSRLARWLRVAISAAEQSGRAVVPRLDPVATLRSAVAALGDASEGHLRLVATEPSINLPAQVATETGTVRSVTVAVGPAGGLSPDDLQILTGAGFCGLRLAPHTLRSETACLAALAILGARYP